jgi:hypothetical protein
MELMELMRLKTDLSEISDRGTIAASAMKRVSVRIPCLGCSTDRTDKPRRNWVVSLKDYRLS